MDFNIKEEYRARRLKKRIRIREISEFLGCTKGLISNWENDRGYMSKEKVNRYMLFIDNYNEVMKVETLCCQ
ncbi:XRE family transcriptional regulator [Paenibacillus aurantius]|uniref:XRE family transcriptional regulator n=1 Tax=Paenibacillus aurantius TaxID=2918900 RepID=A0AA96RIC9_9BACL|nr:XRE family transcriptional regulator [Paenibacillus aurantius]WNQ12059.1 XRE family transcriptional regulator [Paenibacillus aurantius]